MSMPKRESSRHLLDVSRSMGLAELEGIDTDRASDSRLNWNEKVGCRVFFTTTHGARRFEVTVRNSWLF